MNPILRRIFVLLSILGVGVIFVMYLIWNTIQPSPGVSMTTYNYPFIIEIEEGNGKIKPLGSDIFLPVDGKEYVNIGDTIQVAAASEATIQWPNGALSRIGERSEVVVKKGNQSMPSEIILELSRGKLWNLDIRRNHPHRSFTVDTTFGTALLSTGTTSITVKDKSLEIISDTSVTEFYSPEKDTYYVIPPQGLAVITQAGEMKLEQADLHSLNKWAIANTEADKQYLTKLYKQETIDMKDAITVGLYSPFRWVFYSKEKVDTMDEQLRVLDERFMQTVIHPDQIGTMDSFLLALETALTMDMDRTIERLFIYESSLDEELSLEHQHLRDALISTITSMLGTNRAREASLEYWLAHLLEQKNQGISYKEQKVTLKVIEREINSYPELTKHIRVRAAVAGTYRVLAEAGRRDLGNMFPDLTDFTYQQFSPGDQNLDTSNVPTSVLIHPDTYTLPLLYQRSYLKELGGQLTGGAPSAYDPVYETTEGSSN